GDGIRDGHRNGRGYSHLFSTTRFEVPISLCAVQHSPQLRGTTGPSLPYTLGRGCQ
ncbi:unnamed protein product, partial [Choristocarpus tenellus]